MRSLDPSPAEPRLLSALLLSSHKAQQLPVTALTALLRRGRTFLDRFITKGMPFLSAHFLSHNTDILAILKTLQLSTRTLQALCAHSKARDIDRPFPL